MRNIFHDISVFLIQSSPSALLARKRTSHKYWL